MKPAIIVGFDPGTTAGYAIIDVSGKVLRLDSARGIDLASMIRGIISIGRVLAVASDKKKTPDSVEKLAVKTGGKLIWPDHDLLTEEKKDLSKDFKGNTHEMDALASALFAYRKLQPIIRKCLSFAEKEGLQDKVDDLILLTVKHGLNIKTASELLMDTGDDKELVLDNIEDATKDASKLILLYSRIKSLSKRIEHIKREKQDTEEKLSMQIRINRKLYVAMSKEKIMQKIEKASKEKDRKIQLLQNSLERTKRDLASQEEMNRMKREIILSSRGNIIAIAIRTLSKKDLLHVKDEDVVYVDNSSEYSIASIKRLKGIILIGRRFPIEVKKNAYTIDSEDVKIIARDDGFAIIEKKSFLQAQKKDVFERIVKDYKSERRL